jgi:UDP-glucose 4-epimerase
VIAAAAETPAAYNQVFNVGADRPCSVEALARAVARVMGCEARLQHLPARHEVQDAYSSHERQRRVFGRREPVALEDGLARMARWVRAHGARTSKAFDAIEVTRHLPAVWTL